MGRKKRTRSKKKEKQATRDIEQDFVDIEEIEPMETGWEFHKIPLIISVVITIIFYICVFIFVK